MSKRQDFLRTVVPAREAAGNALINGDPERPGLCQAALSARA